MKFVNLYSPITEQKGRAVHFTTKHREMRIGYWNTFPLRKPIAFRSSENLSTSGWQLDVLFFSVAVKYI